jgi:hypothetical protein
MIQTKYRKKTRVSRKTRVNRKTKVNRKTRRRFRGGSLLVDEGFNKNATVAVNGKVMSMSEFLRIKQNTPEAFLYV